MGLYDTLAVHESHTLPGFSGDPGEVDWQTKTIETPTMERYKISADGRLLKEDAEYETVPETKRTLYDEDIGGFEEPWHKWMGAFSKTHHGWTDTEFHGVFEMHQSVNGEYISYDVKFTDGELVKFSKND